VKAIRNVRIVDSYRTSEPMDVFIQDSKISGIHKSGIIKGDYEVYDGKGMLAIPGLVDLHFHPMVGKPDQLQSGMKTEGMAALAGGFTYLRCQMLVGLVSERGWVPLIEKMISDAEKSAPLDFSFNPQLGNLKHVSEVPQLITHGINGFKLFFDAYRGEVGRKLGIVAEENIRQVLQGILAAISMNPQVRLIVHAEDEDYIQYITGQPKTGGKGILEAFSDSRPPFAEVLKQNELASLAEEFGSNVHIAHVSGERSLRAVLAAKQRYPNITFETEPHYLLLDYTMSKKLGVYGKVVPPLRSPADRKALVSAVANRKVDSISTDTNPCTKAEKENGESKYGNIDKVSPGFDNIQVVLPLLITNFVKKNVFTINDLVWAMSDRPSQVFWASQKGGISVGKDADLVLLDLTHHKKVSSDSLVRVGGNEWFLFEGEDLYGMPEATFLRGSLVYNDGAYIGGESGKYIRFRQSLKKVSRTT